MALKDSHKIAVHDIFSSFFSLFSSLFVVNNGVIFSLFSEDIWSLNNTKIPFNFNSSAISFDSCSDNGGLQIINVCSNADSVFVVRILNGKKLLILLR